MKWLSFLSKPAWESADPAKRAAAVASESHADLLAKISDFARHDTDAEVRKAAVRRVSDLSLLADRARLDANADVRDVARLRLRQFMLDGKTPFEQRQRQVLATEDHDLLESVAIHSPETDMRRAALERIQRPGFLIERCLKDADPQLRIELLGRIEDPAALERIADAARKSDKRLSRSARDRLTADKLKSGDPATIRQRAEAICVELEGFIRQRPDNLPARLTSLAGDWQSLQPTPEESLQRRYLGLTGTLQHMLEVAARPPLVAVVEIDPMVIAEPEVPALIEAAEIVDVEDADLRALVDSSEHAAPMSASALEEMQQRFRDVYARAPKCPSNSALQQRYEQCLQKSRAAMVEHGKLLEQSKQAAQAAVADYAHAIDAGRLGDARSARQRAHALTSVLPHADRDGRKLDMADADFDKLQRWQRWSNDSQRKRLCDEIEANIGSGEHPDALLTRIKNAQAEWTRLEESERDPGQPEATASGLTKRFRVLCAKAIAPARPYLEKRSAIRSQKFDEVRAVVEAIELALAGSEINDLQALRKQTIEGLRALDEVAPQERRKLSERLRTAKDTLDARVEAARAQAEEEKRKFISQLRRRLGTLEGADAINAAKDAMSRWKSLPRSDRKLDDALWAELRSVVDPVFEKSKTDRIELEAAQTADRDAIQTLIAEAELLATSEHDAHALDTRKASLQQRWAELSNRSRDDDRAFDRHADAIAVTRTRRQSEAAERSRSETLNLRSELIALTEGSDAQLIADLRIRLQNAPILAADRSALLSHLNALQAAEPMDVDVAVDVLQRDAVLAELLAGVDTPAEHLPLRKQVQMQRLADKLGSGASKQVVDEAGALWLRWLGSYGAPAQARAALDARIQAALLKKFVG